MSKGKSRNRMSRVDVMRNTARSTTRKERREKQRQATRAQGYERQRYDNPEAGGD